MKNKLFVLAGAVLLLVAVAVPVLVDAQVTTVGSTTTCNATVSNLFDILCRVGNILNKIVPILLVLGVVYFVWGVITYVVGGDAESKAEGRTRMIWGVIGFVVIIGLWGFVRYIGNTFGVNNSIDIPLPTVPFGLP